MSAGDPHEKENAGVVCQMGHLKGIKGANKDTDAKQLSVHDNTALNWLVYSLAGQAVIDLLF